MTIFNFTNENKKKSLHKSSFNIISGIGPRLYMD